MYYQKSFKNIRSKSKYKNKVILTKEGKFDSKLESKVAQDLEWRKKAGEIKDYEKQVKIEFNFYTYPPSLDLYLTIQPLIELKNYIAMKAQHLFNYYIDFKVYHNDDTIEFIEVKGLWLEPGKTKFRLLEIYLKDKPEYSLTLIKK